MLFLLLLLRELQHAVVRAVQLADDEGLTVFQLFGKGFLLLFVLLERLCRRLDGVCLS